MEALVNIYFSKTKSAHFKSKTTIYLICFTIRHKKLMFVVRKSFFSFSFWHSAIIVLHDNYKKKDSTLKQCSWFGFMWGMWHTTLLHHRLLFKNSSGKWICLKTQQRGTLKIRHMSFSSHCPRMQWKSWFLLHQQIPHFPNVKDFYIYSSYIEFLTLVCRA